MRHWVLPGALAVLLAVVGCSNDEPATEPSAQTSASSAPASASASSSRSTLPAAECLTGRWTLVRFVGVGGSSNDTYGTGEGGDVTLTFDGDGYTVAGAGKKPVTVTLAGQSGEMTVDGSANGTFTTGDATATFTQTGAEGEARLSRQGQRGTLPMQEVSQVMAPEGEARVACTADAMTLTLQATRLELGRV